MNNHIALQPLANRVVIRPDKVEEVSKGGIVLPGASKGKSDRGVVLAVGPGKLLEDGTRVPLTIEVGDKVIFSTLTATEITHEEEKLVVVIEEDVIGILR